MVRAVHKLFKLTDSHSIKSLPKAYLDYLEKSRAPKERVHDDAPATKYLDYDQDHQTGFVYRVPDQPVHVVYPPYSESALWGGLGMIEGFIKPKKMRPRIAKIWCPQIERHTFYSEVLDYHINVDVTDRTLELIDVSSGFDFYILKTPAQDLVSELGRRLQRKMMLALSRETRDYIIEKYKDYIKPIEEVQWHGLKEHEALIKFRLMRVEETIEPPLRQTYARELIKELKEHRKQIAEAK